MDSIFSLLEVQQFLAGVGDTVYQFGAALACYAKHLLIAGLASLLIGIRPFTTKVTRSRPKLNRVRKEIVNISSVTLLLLIFTVSAHEGKDESQTEQLERNRARMAKRVTFSLVELSRPGDQAVDSALQAMGEVASITFEDLRILFPGMKFRAVSIFLWIADSGVAEDLIHTPEPAKDYPFFGEGSLVFKSIITREKRYCPDLSKRDAYGQCLPFKEPAPGTMQFLSLLCFPLTYEGTVVGSLCLDAATPHAFDAEANVMALTAREEVEEVAALLWIIQRVRSTNLRCVTGLAATGSRRRASLPPYRPSRRTGGQGIQGNVQRKGTVN